VCRVTVWYYVDKDDELVLVLVQAGMIKTQTRDIFTHPNDFLIEFSIVYLASLVTRH
jgi:hypothetical protein